MFKRGDKAKLVKVNNLHTQKAKIGEIYTIAEIDETDERYTYRVEEIEDWFSDRELELIDKV